jgi:glycosyltransferase involved in cell wall biosynthesis
MDAPGRYVLITPTRDEATNLRRVADSLSRQTLAPERWIIVDNGSSDDTISIARNLEERFDWVEVVLSPGTDVAEPGLPIVRAFHRGLECVDSIPDVVVKLDADVSMEPDYFERLIGAFVADRALGIASGVCYEHDGTEWRPTHVTEAHVRGATRAYRWECLQQVLPLEERVGWDGIDELKANVAGWRTAVIPNLAFLHHRRLGTRDGMPWARWARQGRAAHYMGYRFSYLVLRSLHHARRNPAALAMLATYLSAAARRAPRHDDARVRRHLRERQRLRNLRARRREALGQESASPS